MLFSVHLCVSEIVISYLEPVIRNKNGGYSKPCLNTVLDQTEFISSQECIDYDNFSFFLYVCETVIVYFELSFTLYEYFIQPFWQPLQNPAFKVILEWFF